MKEYHFRDVRTNEVMIKLEANTFCEAVEIAVSSDIDLAYIDLSGEDLSNANLEGANLEGANLEGANLNRANLWGANLEDANLEDANLRNTIGNSKEIITIQTEIYAINLTEDRIQIGCENHPIEDWFAFNEHEIHSMGGSHAVDCWKIYKPVIQSLVKARDKYRAESEEVKISG